MTGSEHVAPTEWTFECPQTSRTIQAYSWMPKYASGESVKGAVFLVHGYRSHARFNFLLSFPPATYDVYNG